jgi:ElaB/YqjD/DUF883 family membrane-anchored ribosome-binding protein
VKITKRQLRRIIREESLSLTGGDIEQYLRDNATTYHQDPNLDAEAIAMLLRDDFMDDVGAQIELTDEYEGLINDLSQDPGAVVEVTKRQLRRIIKEEKSKLLSEQDHEMYASDDELRELGDFIGDLKHYSSEVDAIMKEMGMRYGELAALGTDARTIKNSIQELQDKYASKLDDMLRFR